VTELKRTAQEITARINELATLNLREAEYDSQTQTSKMIRPAVPRDLHGTERSALLESLPWSDAQQFLRSGSYTEEQWDSERTKDCGEVMTRIQSMLELAWAKANGRRGVSVQKTLAAFRGLTWLLADAGAELEEYLSKSDYRYHGKPQLLRVSKFAGYPWQDEKRGDDNRWVDANGDDPLTADAALRGL